MTNLCQQRINVAEKQQIAAEAVQESQFAVESFELAALQRQNFQILLQKRFSAQKLQMMCDQLVEGLGKLEELRLAKKYQEETLKAAQLEVDVAQTDMAKINAKDALKRNKMTEKIGVKVANCATQEKAVQMCEGKIQKMQNYIIEFGARIQHEIQVEMAEEFKQIQQSGQLVAE